MAALVDAGEPAKQPTRLDCSAVPLLCQGSEIAQKVIREVRPDVAASLALEPGVKVCRSNHRHLGDPTHLHLMEPRFYFASLAAAEDNDRPDQVLREPFTG